MPSLLEPPSGHGVGPRPPTGLLRSPVVAAALVYRHQTRTTRAQAQTMVRAPGNARCCQALRQVFQERAAPVRAESLRQMPPPKLGGACRSNELRVHVRGSRQRLETHVRPAGGATLSATGCGAATGSGKPGDPGRFFDDVGRQPNGVMPHTRALCVGTSLRLSWWYVGFKLSPVPLSDPVGP